MLTKSKYVNIFNNFICYNCKLETTQMPVVYKYIYIHKELLLSDKK